jgi:hypothetical protein
MNYAVRAVDGETNADKEAALTHHQEMEDATATDLLLNGMIASYRIAQVRFL